MSRRLSTITLDTLDQLPDACRRCVAWELHPVAADRARAGGATALEKEAWISSVLLDWGACGTLIHVDGTPAGFALYAPPVYVPRAAAFPTSPVSPDAALLMSARVLPGFEGGGLGRMLLQGVAKDVMRRGLRAIEAFGHTEVRERSDLDAAPGRESACLIPADFLLAVGFKTVRPHHRYPRLRMDLRTALSWREDMEGALERLIGSMSPEPALRPV